MSRVFISYSREDAPFVARLAEDLRSGGHEVWVDEAEVDPGDPVLARIEQALGWADYVFAVISQAALESQWVRVELRMAADREISDGGLVVVPLLREDVDLRAYLYLRGKDYADFTDDAQYGTSLERLLRALRKRERSGVPAEPRPGSPGAAALADTGLAAPPPAATPPAGPAQARALLRLHRQAYTEGRIRESLKHIETAHRLDPRDTEIANRYIVALLRHGRPVRFLLGEIKESGRYDDRVRAIEAEVLLREGKHEEALAVLHAIRDETAYNVQYLRGMARLFQYQSDKQGGWLLRALAEFQQARARWPGHWWITVNLAIVQRLLGTPDTETEALAQTQLQEAVARHPSKASPRIYRLLLHAVRDDLEGLRRQAETDRQEAAGRLEVGPDLLDWIQFRVRLLIRDDPGRQAAFRAEISRWATYFDILT